MHIAPQPAVGTQTVKLALLDSRSEFPVAMPAVDESIRLVVTGRLHVGALLVECGE